MKMRKYAPASFIGVDDVRDGPIRGTIAKVEDGSFDKPVITFTNGTRFSCSKTNVGILIEELGDESDDYLGERVELYAGTTRFQGADKDVVLLRVLPRAEGEEKRPPPKPAKGDLDDDIPY